MARKIHKPTDGQCSKNLPVNNAALTASGGMLLQTTEEIEENQGMHGMHGQGCVGQG